GLRIGLSQAANTGFPRLYNLYAISTDADAYLTYGLYAYASGASSNNYGVYAYAPTSNGYAGYFSGNVYTTGAYQPSDARLKSDISPLQGGLNTIMQLQAKRYTYDREQFDFMNLPEGEQYGFLAQDLQQLLPTLTNRAFQAYDEALSDTHEGQGFEFTAVNYIGLIPIMVAGIQEQQQVIDSQKAEIEALKARLDRLEAVLLDK
ncbi:MAG: tail fiber domain-containing protein, partial [Bacteroidia bacterium]|nr:tail fiber domain-containing protein [Bacteroidia bacterium]